MNILLRLKKESRKYRSFLLSFYLDKHSQIKLAKIFRVIAINALIKIERRGYFFIHLSILKANGFLFFLIHVPISELFQL